MGVSQRPGRRSNTCRGKILAVAALTVMTIIASRSPQSSKLSPTRVTTHTDIRRSRQGDSRDRMEFRETFEWEVLENNQPVLPPPEDGGTIEEQWNWRTMSEEPVTPTSSPARDTTRLMLEQSWRGSTHFAIELSLTEEIWSFSRKAEGLTFSSLKPSRGAAFSTSWIT